MKNFLVVSNIIKDPDGVLSGKIVNYLKDKGVDCRSTVCTRDCNNNYHLTDYEGTDCIIVLGGDGTILQVARDIADKNIPIMGVNLGTVGYLAEVDADKVNEAIDRVLKGDYATETRMMLQGDITANNGEITHLSPALNDIVITRNGALQIIRFSIYVNDQFLCDFSADGIIIATPTGSTGYNMSAGGPIAKPSASLLLLTPICAHSGTPTSIVLSDSDKVDIVINKGRDGNSIFVAANSDGNDEHVMTTDDRITISKSKYVSTIIRLDSDSFVQTLHKKMSE
ncbi:MAG: NAD(+)/NADH kinase [Lachnospiraceae bacterium]|nr:NAD(+)/NADH kinase [Candidatus Colinaster equi]